MSYLMAPSTELAPGTSLVQFMRRGGNGFGSYVGTPTYWGTPAGQAGIRGLGCVCGCGHCNDGFGYFDSGMDYTQWGVPEWATVALGAYALISVLFTTSRVTRATVEGVRRTRKRIGKRIAGQ